MYSGGLHWGPKIQLHFMFVYPCGTPLLHRRQKDLGLLRHFKTQCWTGTTSYLVTKYEMRLTIHACGKGLFFFTVIMIIYELFIDTN